MTKVRPSVRRVLLVAAAAAALTAVMAGLARMGVGVPAGSSRAAEHGPLFVVGTFGVVIALERAVAFGARWAYLAPALAALASLALVASGPAAAAFLAVAAACALFAVNSAIVRRRSAPFTWLMALGSASLVAGNALWASGWPVLDVVPCWIGFFVLTIVAERLELSRLAPTPHGAMPALVAFCAALVLAVGATLAGVHGTLRALGVILALVASWQLRFDLARRTIRQPGLPRFAATGVLSGAAWLFAAGILLALLGLPATGPTYDAVVHAVMVGYVLSMVIAHAPIILPAVAQIDVPFHRALYLPWAVLQLGLIARIAGDLLDQAELRRVGGLGNAIALGLLPAAILWSRRQRTRAHLTNASTRCRYIRAGRIRGS